MILKKLLTIKIPVYILIIILIMFGAMGFVGKEYIYPTYFLKNNINSPAVTIEDVNNIKVPILLYHHIRDYQGNLSDPTQNEEYGLSVSISNFESQIKYLADNQYNSIDMSTLINLQIEKKHIPLKTIVLTFDDGYDNFYTNAFPILQKYSIHAEIYVVSSFIGQSGYMTKDMINTVITSGLVTLGSHTIDHRELTKIPINVVQDEVVRSKRDLEIMFNMSIKDFCYPFGSFNSDVANEVYKADYSNAVTMEQGSWSRNSTQFLVPRLSVGGFTTYAQYVGLVRP